MKKTAVWLTVFLMIWAGLAHAETAAAITAETILDDMLAAYRKPSAEAAERLDRDVETLNEPVLRSVAEYWKQAFLSDDYPLYYFRTDRPEWEIPDPSKHAFVVLGFRLVNGEMARELRGRCLAAAEAAKAWPDALVICTGGASGTNNPERKTEAALMADYLNRRCGISLSRVRQDPKAMSTVQNVLNSFHIMQEEGIETLTVVTSGYHMRWAVALFTAAAAWYREQGYPVRIIGNWCYNTRPAKGYDQMNAQKAVSQLKTLLITGNDAFFPAKTSP
ncbi:MAG: YdcF family protein [Clostridia bacterium]|nr:YdcF family protein [Clostridia bacterium]